MKHLLYFSFITLLGFTAASCEKIEEEPEINLGYEKNVRVSDPEELTDEDKTTIQEQTDEYNTNAR